MTMRAILAGAGEALTSLLSPPACAACDEPLVRRSVFCARCAATVAWADPFEGAACVYGGAISEAIVRMKFARRADLARPLSHLLFRTALAFERPFDFVVPVPLHRLRLAERGFNQSALLARPVARVLSVPFLPVALERTRATPRQTDLDADARRASVLGAFRARDERVRGARLLLVDDVRTTGATLDACALALGDAGALSVDVLALAIAR